jgi:hypothetical protein
VSFACFKVQSFRVTIENIFEVVHVHLSNSLTGLPTHTCETGTQAFFAGHVCQQRLKHSHARTSMKLSGTSQLASLAAAVLLSVANEDFSTDAVLSQLTADQPAKQQDLAQQRSLGAQKRQAAAADSARQELPVPEKTSTASEDAMRASFANSDLAKKLREKGPRTAEPLTHGF